MPTGYTVKIADGIDFEEFVMGCSRAFGACVTIRDDSLEEVIPDVFEPSRYHKKSFDKAVEKLAELRAMTDAEIDTELKKDFDKKIKDHTTAVLKNNNLKIKYKKMLHKVLLWEPPTKEHNDLHEFMEDQIKKSIEFDCHDYSNDDVPKRLTKEEWISEKKNNCVWEINYHDKHWKEEVELCKKRTIWIKQLRESL